MSILPNTLSDIITKVRRITGRPSTAQISDTDIEKYINTFYVYDLPEHLKLISLRYNYQFTTSANQAVYDLPTGTYLTAMPPVYIAGYQTYMTQSRDNFFRINPILNFLQQAVYTGNGTAGPYTGQSLTNTPLLQGFQPNPPGVGSFTTVGGIKQANTPAKFIQWNVLVSALGTPDSVSGIASSVTLIDDGYGNLIDPNDSAVPPASFPIVRGSVNYTTGAISINSTGFTSSIPSGNAINVQYVPYVASRPQQCVFFQDQIILYPIPDQAYTVSFEAYKYPTAFLGTSPTTETPQLLEWWQMLALGASLKIFEDNGDMDNYMKFRPIFEEYMNLSLRRTIVQQTSERTATIYTEQSSPYAGWPFGNLFSGF